jgi:hypothetical protein
MSPVSPAIAFDLLALGVETIPEPGGKKVAALYPIHQPKGTQS